MIPRLVTHPQEPVVTVLEAKKHFRVDHPEDDVMIGNYLTAATAHLDGYFGILGRCIVNQTWAVTASRWDRKMILPFPDVSGVVLTYRDADEAVQTVASTDFFLYEGRYGSELNLRSAFLGPALSMEAWPITVTLTAGFGTADDVPWTLKVAILLLAGHWYASREAVSASGSQQQTTVPLGFDALISPYRRMWA